jgi:hypothetical protein
MDCCDHCQTSDPERGNSSYRRALWIVLGINAVMFLVEIGAGLAVGSASLQADALDFLGDAANYGISLLVVGMALRYRAMAAFAKGVSMGAFGLWVIATVVWHAVQGTLPSAVAMGAVGSAALTANAISFGILWFHRMGDSNMRSAWIARVMTCSGIWRCCSRRLACSAPARGARPCGRRHHGNSCAAGCVHRAAITRRTASAQAHRGADHRTSYPQLVCAAGSSW